MFRTIAQGMNWMVFPCPSLSEETRAVKDGLHTDAQTTRVRRTTFAIARLLRRTDGKPL